MPTQCALGEEELDLKQVMTIRDPIFTRIWDMICRVHNWTRPEQTALSWDQAGG